MIPGIFAGAAGGGSGGNVPSWANVVALVHLDSPIGAANPVDAQGRTWSIGLSGGTLQASAAKFGQAGWSAPGAYSRLRLNHSSHYFGSDDFTIEAWARTNSTTGNRCLLSRSNNGAATIEWRLYQDGSNSQKITFIATIGGAVVTLVGSALTVGVYTHVAVCRSGGVVRLFVAGQGQDSAAVSGSLHNENTYTGIGGLYDNLAGWIWNGSIDEVRLTREAVYLTDFTPPTSPFPDS